MISDERDGGGESMSIIMIMRTRMMIDKCVYVYVCEYERKSRY